MHAGEVIAERFEIERLAGTGGMGAVYRAKDRLTGEPVALKMLLVRTTRSPERFLREGRVLAELSHPGIVKYVAHGTTPTGEPYLVMEWLDGETVADRLGRAPLSVSESVVLLRRVAETLSAAHAKDIIHRDIKPSNLFLPARDIGRVKLLDFGLARLVNATRLATATGALLGTPGYMAPEQAMGERAVDARADVFALGCVFFECLTGRHAFVAENVMGILAKIVLEDAPRVREIRPDINPALDELAFRMLAKDPRSRPANAGAVVAKLDSIGAVASEELTAAIPSSGFQPRITEREQRLVSIVLAGTKVDSSDVARAVTIDAGAATQSLDIIRRAVGPYGGQFEWLADGSLIGTLEAHGAATDQAAQAARCALAIRDQMTGVPVVLATGKSVAFGRLPVGEVIDRATRLLHQHAVALAAREERRRAGGSVPPSSMQGTPIRLDEVTAGLLDTRFEIAGDDTGLVLLGEREPAFGTRRLLGKVTPCVGRDRELKTLEAIFDECADEPVARAVLITAPAGVGKSRLRHELLLRVRERNPRVAVWIGRGDPMSAGSPFGMLAQALRRAAGLRDGEALGVRQQKLRARVSRYVSSANALRVAEFLGELVGTPFPDEASVQLRAARQEPVLMGDQMRRAFEDFLAAECSERPLLLVLEDLHWGDLPTVRFVDAALRTLAERPFMAIALARPEVHQLFPSLWGERRTQEVRLEELTKKASERLVREVLGESVTPELVVHLAQRSAGNAFYLEELIRAVAEGKGDALPETVLAMAQARLDALAPDARRLLRAASVFGGTFWRGGVHALLGADRKTKADEWLEELTLREVITARSDTTFDGELEYAFRHALVREVAYASLTDSDKKLGHLLAARWLEATGERDAMVLAEHFERAGEQKAAILHYVAAAEHALQGNDFTATLARAERAVSCGAEGETMGRLRLLQAEAYRWIGEFANAERAGAVALSHLTPGTALFYAGIGELASASGLVGNHERLVSLCESLQAGSGDARASEAAVARVIASARAVVQLLHNGKYALAGELLDGLDEARKPLASDPAVDGWVGRARTIQAGKSGDTDLGRRAAEQSARSLEAAGDLRTACLQRMNLGYYENEMGLYARAEKTLDAALADATRLGLHHVTAPGKTFLGYALVGQNRFADAQRVLLDAIELFVQQGDRRMDAASRNHLSRALLGLGDVEGAIREAELAVELCASIPSMRATAFGSLALALIAAGRLPEALAAAESGMTILSEMGGVDQGEARLRLAHVLALEAMDRGDEALRAILVAQERILRRAAGISDPEVRKSFRESVAENDATLRTAALWASPETRRY